MIYVIGFAFIMILILKPKVIDIGQEDSDGKIYFV